MIVTIGNCEEYRLLKKMKEVGIMVLIDCPECNAKISDKAEHCIYCGCPGQYFVKDEKDISEVNQTGSYVWIVDSKNIERVIESFFCEYEVAFNNAGHLSKFTIFKQAVEYQEVYEKLKKIPNKDDLVKYFPLLAEKIQHFMDKMDSLEMKVEKHNSTYMSKLLAENEQYLDTVLANVDPKISLDEEQRKVVLSDANYSLVVAGAGAGKTTTMAAKVKYLVNIKNIKPEEIIVISFTNKAVKELAEKINNQLGIPADVMTFHKFGNRLIQQTASLRPEVETNKRKYFYKILREKIYDSKKLLRDLVLFFGYYFDLPENILEYETIEQYHNYKLSLDYETIRSTLGEYSQEIIDNYSKNKRTIRGEFLRSVQEVQIANYLYLHGIDYEYEKIYEYDIVGSNKKYTPDFYIKQGDKAFYLEHFGIGEDGTSAIYSQEELNRYKESIEDKVRLHKAKGTKLLYTFSMYTDRKPLIEHLEALLLNEGIHLVERDDEEIYKELMNLEKDKYVSRFVVFLETFIGMFKTNGYEEKDFKLLKDKVKNVRTELFLDIAREVFRMYQAMLTYNNRIDFEDMINIAEKTLADELFDSDILNYKYIIVDEYQDIAKQRFNLTKRLAEVCNAKVVAVGDDWQSIYAFSGSDINLFTKFIKLMGQGEELRITNTYRNSQELIDIAGDFVQVNPSQIIKKLQSPKHIENPVVIQAYDDSSEIMRHKTEALVKVVGEIIQEFGERAEILFIGRYGFEVNQICKRGDFTEGKSKDKLKCKKYPKVRITYMTAHSSKGLGYENVVILNGSEGKFGFPSQIEDDPIMKLVTINDLSVPFAEERRLFYVAITRTKNRVYIMTPICRPSQFVLELIDRYNLKCEMELNKGRTASIGAKIRCPQCGFPLKKEYNKNYGLTLYMCTNEPEICDFMANRAECLANIHKCDHCDGYMIVKKNKDGPYFFGCTNYNVKGINCKNSENIK